MPSVLSDPKDRTTIGICFNFGVFLVVILIRHLSSGFVPPTRISRPPALVVLQSKNDFTASIQTAQWLLNDRKHDLLREELQKKYPILPSAVLDTAIDVV